PNHSVKVVMPLHAEGFSSAGFPIVTVPEFTAQSQFKAQQAICLGNFIPRVLAAGVASARHLIGEVRALGVGLALTELGFLRPVDSVPSLLADAVPATLTVAENAQRVTDLSQGVKQQILGYINARDSP